MDPDRIRPFSRHGSDQTMPGSGSATLDMRRGRAVPLDFLVEGVRTIPLEFLSGKEETGASREGRLFTELLALLDANLRGSRGPREGIIRLVSQKSLHIVHN